MMKLLLFLSLVCATRAEGIDYNEYREYTVRVHTGDVASAGTNANVYLTVLGDIGVTAEHLLDIPSYNDFERNEYDIFQFVDIDVGPIKKIRIRHDNSGFKPGWFLDFLTVEIYTDGIIEQFPCNWWLADDEPGGIDRILSPGQSCSPYTE